MFKFISFGSGSSGNCYYLYTEEGGLLIDVGIGVRALKKSFGDYGLKFLGGFGAILVTHDHADHIKSVGSLSKKFDIPVYATELVHTGMDKNYCMRCKLSHEHRRYVEKGSEFHVGAFRVTAFGVPHDSSDNVGYSIEYEGYVFCILTDAGRITDDMREAISKANFLVIEANYDSQMLEVGPYPRYLKDRIRNGRGHLCNTECAAALAENISSGMKHIWLCHLSEENNRPEIAESTVRMVLAEANADFADNLKIDVLRRTKPTGIFELS